MAGFILSGRPPGSDHDADHGVRRLSEHLLASTRVLGSPAGGTVHLRPGPSSSSGSPPAHEGRGRRSKPRGRRGPGLPAGNRRQALGVGQATVTAITRPLHHLPSSSEGERPTAWKAREKGIDVLIAIDMVMGAVREEYDVAVLMSADTDLVPAVEAVLALGKRAKVASWSPEQGWGSRLAVPGRKIWCHWLDRGDFERVRDATDYTRSTQDGPPPM